MENAETLMPVEFVDTWEKECGEDIKEAQIIVVEVQDIVVKDQRLVIRLELAGQLPGQTICSIKTKSCWVGSYKKSSLLWSYKLNKSS